MEVNNDLDGLLVAFLLKELSTEEEENLTKAIHSDPVLQQRFEELKKLLRLLDIKQSIDGINLEQERNRLEEIRIAKQTALPTIPAQVYDIAEVEVGMKSRTYKSLRAIAVAASVVFILGIGWVMFYKK